MTAAVEDRDHEPAVIRMGNDIARQLAHLPPEQAAAEIAAHVTRFWDPRMRRELLTHLGQGDPSMDPLLVAASERLASG